MSAVAEFLTHSCDADRGIHRRKRGTGFTYVDHDGKTISDSETIARIRALVIPPAWTDVWICVDANGHIQARAVTPSTASSTCTTRNGAGTATPPSSTS